MSDRSDDIALWWLDVTAAGAALSAQDRAKHLLTPDEHRDLRSPVRLAVRTALRCALWSFTGERAARTPIALAVNGRPHLVDCDDVVFSISHTGNAALIAIARDDPLGVDIEAPRSIAMAALRQRQIVDGARRHGLAIGGNVPLAEDQVAIEPLAFLAVWTQLEAVAKARGDGIGAVLEAIGLHRAHDLAPPSSPATLLPRDCIVTNLTLPDNHVGALAHHRTAGAAGLRRFPTNQSDVRSLCR